jgi:hypothetical protein
MSERDANSTIRYDIYSYGPTRYVNCKTLKPHLLTRSRKFIPLIANQEKTLLRDHCTLVEADMAREYF